MKIIEIEDGLAVEIIELAKLENKSLNEFVDLSLREAINKKIQRGSDEEKLKRFAESYKKFPMQPKEHEIWQNEQIW